MIGVAWLALGLEGLEGLEGRYTGKLIVSQRREGWVSTKRAAGGRDDTSVKKHMYGN